MTVLSESSRSQYTGNGVTTVFSTGWYFHRSSDVRVLVTPLGGSQTVLTEGVHYNVTLPASVGAAGLVTFLAAPALDTEIVLERDVDLTQETSFRSQLTFSPSVHEDALDREMFAIQELDRRVGDLESAGAPGSVVAGNGLSFSGANLHVGAGPGVQVNADNVEVLFGPPVSPVYFGSPFAGVENTAARSDHGHTVVVGAPADLAVGNAADLGSGTPLALANHVHGVPAGAPVAVTKAANAAGVATTFARSDHKHDVTTAAAITLTDSTNAEGAATSLARSDHTHAHGDRGGGTLHQVAVAGGAAGFMSGADKLKLDGLANETLSTAKVVTNNATPTTVLSFTPTDGVAEEIDLAVVGKQSSSANAGGYRRKFTVVRHDGTTSLVGTVDTLGADKESTAAWDITISIVSPQVVVQVTGAAATTITWVARARRLPTV